MHDYCDATEFKNHPLFSKNPHALQLILYYDDIEVCNPLGSRRTKHKIGKYQLYACHNACMYICPLAYFILSIGIFYYMIGNLSPKYRSKVNSIQLLAMVKTKHIKTYSMNAVLSSIIDDVIKLV